MIRLFADLSADDVLERTAAMWDLSGPLPVPRGDWMRCPVCGSADLQVRWYRWHRRPSVATIRGRCDVSMKCAWCAALWQHGIAIPDDVWEQRARIGPHIQWRQARTMLLEHDPNAGGWTDR